MSKEISMLLGFVEFYNKWLLKEGYCDTDIIYELDGNDIYNLITEFLKS